MICTIILQACCLLISDLRDNGYSLQDAILYTSAIVIQNHPPGCDGYRLEIGEDYDHDLDVDLIDFGYYQVRRDIEYKWFYWNARAFRP